MLQTSLWKCAIRWGIPHCACLRARGNRDGNVSTPGALLCADRDSTPLTGECCRDVDDRAGLRVAVRPAGVRRSARLAAKVVRSLLLDSLQEEELLLRRPCNTERCGQAGANTHRARRYPASSSVRPRGVSLVRNRHRPGPARHQGSSDATHNSVLRDARDAESLQVQNGGCILCNNKDCPLLSL